eukprot:XP_001705205.1 Hypothetical protein GL50803_38693 [Giardia lamblia ATCC 50803]
MNCTRTFLNPVTGIARRYLDGVRFGRCYSYSSCSIECHINVIIALGVPISFHRRCICHEGCRCIPNSTPRRHINLDSTP